MFTREVRALLAALAGVFIGAAPLDAIGAQTVGTIRGQILDAPSRQPLSDVRVSVEGTALAAVSNAAGEITITNVPVGQHRVRVRRLGYAIAERTVAVAAGQTARVDVSLSPSATNLEALVITGTAGAAERKTVGNSITQLDVSDITQKQAVLNVTEVLQSKTPGVTILPGSGAPGTAGEIRIRGASSISGYKPVVFIDGLRYSIDDLGSFSATGGGTLGLAQSTQVTSALNFLNPNDIESIEVIKGPAAATLYGAEVEVGFDAGLFNERMGIDFTYYNKKMTDMLQSVAFAPSLGFPGSQLSNVGEVTNKGLELSLFGTPILTRNFSWDTRLNFSTNSNKLVEFGVPNVVVQNPTGQAYGTVQQHRVGYPLGGYWVTPPQRAADGSALLTSTGQPIYNPGDSARRYIGPSMPTREIGFSNTFTVFRYFRLYALLDFKGGHYIFNQKERSRCQAANDNCWRNNNPAARFPQTAADTILFKELAVYRGAAISPEWIQKADFAKLRELSLTIDVPSNIARLARASSANFVLSGRNLGIWSDYEGSDPEVNSYGGRSFVRIDAYALPMVRRFTAGFNIQY